MSYTKEYIQSVAERLSQLEPMAIEKATKQAAVKALLPAIEGMQQRGFTVVQIAAALNDNGIDVAVSTLKTYMRRASESSRKGAVKTKGKARTQAAKRQVKVQAIREDAMPNTERATFQARADSETI